MAGRLRQAIEDWVYQKIQPTGGPGYFGRVRNRFTRSVQVFSAFMNSFTWHKAPLFFVFPWMMGAYVLVGFEPGIWPYTPEKESEINSGMSGYLADMIATHMQSPVPREIAELFGTLMIDPIMNLFEQYAEKGKTDSLDPKEFARSFHGMVIEANVVTGLADSTMEMITGGQFEGFGRLNEMIQRALGLNFMGWQTMSPLLESGLKPGLERYFQDKFRPMRFSAGDLRDLFALGEIGSAELRKAAAYLGWRDPDIERWIKLAYRTLNEADIWQAYHQHDLTEGQAAARLRALGYAPEDIPLLFKLNPPKTEDEVKDFSASTARKAYREALISKAELLQILRTLDYSDKEAAIIVQLEDLSRVQETKSLAVGQVKAAWSENVITDPEARHWLELAGFGSTEQDVLLQTWKAEAIPEYRKVNLGTVTGAYVEGIINRAAAQKKLESIGLTTEDAKLELDLTEKRNPEAFGVIIPPARKRLTPGQLADLLEVGLISEGQMLERVKTLGYSTEDARLLTDAALLRFLPTPRPMPQVSIERAYVAGVLDRPKSTELLAALGISAANAVIILDTLERENPEAFGEEPPVRIKRLSATELEDLRVAALITSGQMYDYLVLLGYTDADSRLKVTRAEQLAAPYVKPLTEPLVERAYIARVITRDLAKEKLVSLAYSPAESENILTTIDAENAASQDASLTGSNRQPSITALASAVRKTIITEDYYFARCLEMGYTQDDAIMYLVLSVQEERKATETLSLSQVLGAYDAGLLAWSSALTRIVTLGYSDDDARLILRTRKDLIENTDIWYSLATGDLNPYEALNQLISAGYSDDDIYQAFTKLTPSILAAVDLNLADLPDILKELPGGR